MTTELDKAMRAAVDPVMQELDAIESLIVSREEELAELKAARSRGQKLIALLDPENAPAPKKKRSAESHIGEGTVEKILGNVQAYVGANGHTTFNADTVSELTGIHVTTIHKGLKVLHERGTIRLDHMGGARNTTKFYALVGGDLG